MKICIGVEYLIAIYLDKESSARFSLPGKVLHAVSRRRLTVADVLLNLERREHDADVRRQPEPDAGRSSTSSEQSWQRLLRVVARELCDPMRLAHRLHISCQDSIKGFGEIYLPF